MANSSGDVLTVSEVLSDLFPESDALDAETMMEIASGKGVAYSYDESGAAMDYTWLIDQLHEWVPIVAGMLSAVKTLCDLTKASGTPAPPTTEEIVVAYVADRGLLGEVEAVYDRDKLTRAAKATSVRYFQRLST